MADAIDWENMSHAEFLRAERRFRERDLPEHIRAAREALPPEVKLMEDGPAAFDLDEKFGCSGVAADRKAHERREARAARERADRSDDGGARSITFGGR